MVYHVCCCDISSSELAAHIQILVVATVQGSLFRYRERFISPSVHISNVNDRQPSMAANLNISESQCPSTSNSIEILWIKLNHAESNCWQLDVKDLTMALILATLALSLGARTQILRRVQ